MLVRKGLLILLTLALVAGLGTVPAAAGHGAAGKVCVVNDIGGPDNPFNAATAAGTKAALSKFHVDIETLDADNETEIAANIDSFVSAGDCDLIIGIGFLVGIEMWPFVATNPGQYFVVVDFSYGDAYANVAEVLFEPNEAAFLAGYIAAGISETGKVGVFGGLPFPPVTAFMDGYALGVEWYNDIYGASVEVLGWDVDTQLGLFAGTFGDPAAGQALAAVLYDQGADTVFPVAGRTSFGALEEAKLRKAAGDEVRVIGVDFDWFEFLGDRDRVILTSVIKDPGVAVFKQIEAFVNGTWTSGLVFEGLEDGGVEMAPFHKLNRAVPGFLKNDLAGLRAGIIDGSIPTTP